LIKFNQSINQSRVHTQLKYVWLILSTIIQKNDIALNALKFCVFWYYVFHKVV